MTMDEQYNLILKEKGQEEADNFIQEVIESAESSSIDFWAQESDDMSYYGSLA